jgi:hypothetical protein
MSAHVYQSLFVVRAFRTSTFVTFALLAVRRVNVTNLLVLWSLKEGHISSLTSEEVERLSISQSILS